jgi:hypothetical protein
MLRRRVRELKVRGSGKHVNIKLHFGIRFLGKLNRRPRKRKKPMIDRISYIPTVLIISV